MFCILNMWCVLWLCAFPRGTPEGSKANLGGNKVTTSPSTMSLCRQEGSRKKPSQSRRTVGTDWGVADAACVTSSSTFLSQANTPRETSLLMEGVSGLKKSDSSAENWELSVVHQESKWTHQFRLELTSKPLPFIPFDHHLKMQQYYTLGYLSDQGVILRLFPKTEQTSDWGPLLPLLSCVTFPFPWCMTACHTEKIKRRQNLNL